MIRWQKYEISTGSNYYRVWSTRRGYHNPLMEFEILPNGQRIDYLKLDAFWGRVPRPIP